MTEYRTPRGFTVVVNLQVPKLTSPKIASDPNNTDPDRQISAAQRVHWIPELLEMILLDVAHSNGPHGIIEVYKLQRVSRGCARAVKDSLPLRKALFPESNTTINSPVVTTPCIDRIRACKLSVQLYNYGLCISAKASEELVHVTIAHTRPIRSYAPATIDRIAKAAEGQSWSKMQIASKPCRIKIGTVSMSCDSEPSRPPVYMQGTPTLGNVIMRYLELVGSELAKSHKP